MQNKDMPPIRSERTRIINYHIKVDNRTAFQADTLQIDFKKDSFDRKEDAPFDPPTELIVSAANSFITRLRFVTQAFQASYPKYPFSISLRYLNDDETELPQENGLKRTLVGFGFSFSYLILDLPVWEEVHSLPWDFGMPPWQPLLLDAIAQLPNIGTALVLAGTALEVLIERSLELIAVQRVQPPRLWEWINDREWLREPTVEEQFSDLLEIFTGVSLKSNTGLWESFQNLKKARNSFVHKGQPMIGDQIVTLEKAKQLVANAGKICNFVVDLLPKEHRPKRYSHEHSVQVTQPILRKPEG